MSRLDINWTSVIRDVDHFFDFWNCVGVGAGTLGIGIMFGVFGINTQTLLVAITGVYAFISFNQMRQSKWSRNYPGTLTLRPAFEWNGDEEKFKFGLKNFGSGSAINLQGCAIVCGDYDEDALEKWQNGDEESVRRFSSETNHLSLPQGNLLPLIGNSGPASLSDIESLDDLWNENGEVKEQHEGKRIEFYYTFESNTGEQYPRDWFEPCNMDMEVVIKKSQTPRTIEISEIQQKCL